YNFYMGELVAFDDRHAVLAARVDPYARSAVVIFRRGEDGWKHQQTLAGRFGDVALAGSLLLVSASGAEPGMAYREEGDRWVPAGEIGASAGVAAEGNVAAL